MIEWTISQAKHTNIVDYIHVSTDSKEISKIAKKAGAECEFLRPINISGDKIGTGEAIYHSLKELISRGYKFDIVVELQPTYCLRGNELIYQCIDFLKKNHDYDSVITCKKIDTTEHPDYVINENPNGRAAFGLNKPDNFARQYLRPVFACHGLVLATKVSSFLENKTFYTDNCKLMNVEDPNRLLDINSPEDLKIMQLFIKEYPDYLF